METRSLPLAVLTRNAKCGMQNKSYSAFRISFYGAGVMRVKDCEQYSTGSDSDQAIPIAPSAQTPGRHHSLCCT